MKDQVDAAPVIGSGCHFDEVDQTVEQWPRQLHGLAIAGDNLRHAVDLAAIVLNDGRMRDHRFDFRKVFLVGQQSFAARGQFIGARLQLVGRNACDDRIGDAFFGLVDFGQLPIDGGAACDQAAAFIGPCQTEFVEIGCDDIGMQKVALDRRPDPALKDRVGHGRAVAAGSCLAVGAAAPAVGRHDDDRPAARGAAQLAREQAGLPLALGMVAAGIIQALLDLRPGRGGDDLQFGNRLADLVAGGIDAGNPLPAVGVFPEGLPIIDDFAQI
nr:hypothetical protein [Erythrobacter sp. CCH5-A1]